MIGSTEELLNVNLNFSESFDKINSDYQCDHEGKIAFKSGKKHGVWCTILRKIGLKNKRCKEVKNTEKKSNDISDEKAKKKKIKIPKILKSKRKSKKADKIYESLENEEQINPLGSTEVVETYDEDIEETCKYMGKKVHLEVLPESYDLLEESGYETTTDSPVNCEDSEFWSFEDLQLSEEDEEDRLTVKDRFRRAWKNESMKSVRKSLRRTSKQSWKGLQMSLKYQMGVPSVQSVLKAATVNRK